jgi:hypothetical protein
MTANVGKTDKVLRTVAVLIILFLYFNHLVTGASAMVLKIFGLVLAITGLIGFCPFYTIFGFTSNKQTGN